MTAGNNSSIWFLENIDVTGIFCPQKLGASSATHDLKIHKKGDYIYLPDDQADRMFFINEGQVKIGSFSEGGKEITKAILSKGEVFGELALVREGQRGDFALAMEKTSCCSVTLDEMKSLLKDHNGLSLFFLNLMGSRALKMENRLESLVFKDSRSRIVDFLIEMVEKKGERVGFEHVVRKFITHQEIANLTATSRQTVTTVLNELRGRDLIKFDRKRLLVRDLEGLQRASNIVA